MPHAIWIVFFLAATFAFAGPRVEREFASWAHDEDMLPATYAFYSRDGVVLETGGVGAAPDTALPIASISKTIAAQCVLHLIEDGQLALDSTLRDILHWSGPPGRITVAALLTNASGLTAPDRDVDGGGLIAHPESPEKIARLLHDISRRTHVGDPGIFHYNNENWLILEQVVRRIVGRDAIDWCFDTLPALARFNSLRRYDDLRAVGFAGGIAMSAPDLARFFGALTYRDDWPKAAISHTAAYGPGVFIRDGEDGRWMYQTGAYCPDDGVNIGAIAAVLPNGISVAMIYTGCAEAHDIETLNALIARYLTR